MLKNTRILCLWVLQSFIIAKRSVRYAVRDGDSTSSIKEELHLSLFLKKVSAWDRFMSKSKN